MNKKVNTLLFILGATAFNILTAILSFVILLILYIRFLADYIPESERAWGFTFIFIAAMVISFVVYRAIFKYLLKKVDVEKYFDPIFVKKRFRKN
jgi:membrane protein YdbS with pleckstrin-like domain